MMTPGLSFLVVGLRPGFFFNDSCLFEKCAPPFPVARLLGCSRFVDSLGRVEDADNENIQEIISLCGSLMWNDAAD